MATIRQIQEQLKRLGYKITVDGVSGRETTGAIKQFQKDNGLVADGIVGKKTEAKLFEHSTPVVVVKPKILTVTQKIERYGKAGDPRNQSMMKLPYPMRLAWDLKSTVTRIVVNKYIETRLSNVFEDLLDHYGQKKLTSLGIDIFGGCFNHRPMRGAEDKYARAIKAKNYTLAATYLSSHSWAIAIDLDPVRNPLRSTRNTARFARPEYKPMVDIFYRHGFISYGIEKNMDWMHWEIGS